MRIGVPASLMMIPVGWFLILEILPPEIEQLPIGPKEIGGLIEDMGPFSKREKWVCGIFLTTIIVWITSPFVQEATGGRVDMPMQATALGGGLLLFLPGIEAISWREPQEDVSWGGIILICAGISLGMVIFQTGGARWLSWVF